MFSVRDLLTSLLFFNLDLGSIIRGENIRQVAKKDKKKNGWMSPIPPTSMFQSMCQILKYNFKKRGVARRYYHLK